jgi:hypothetical protein
VLLEEVGEYVGDVAQRGMGIKIGDTTEFTKRTVERTRRRCLTRQERRADEHSNTSFDKCALRLVLGCAVTGDDDL